MFPLLLVTPFICINPNVIAEMKYSLHLYPNKIFRSFIKYIHFPLSLPNAHWLSAAFRTEMETYPEAESLSIAAFYVSSWIHLPSFPGLTSALKSNSLYKHAEVIPGMFFFLVPFPGHFSLERHQSNSLSKLFPHSLLYFSFFCNIWNFFFIL